MRVPLDLLIFNPPNPEFYYVPVGTFAICDWLRQRGYQSRIVNLCLPSCDPISRRIRGVLEQYEPRNVGLVLHWKETLNQVLGVGAIVDEFRPGLPIWAGGITAGCFATELLESIPFLSGVIRGDAEIPLERICAGLPSSSIPNLFHRKDGAIAAPETAWWAGGEFLDGLEFGDLRFLDDWPAYLRLVDHRLGIPLAAGRGCQRDCGYCGGSRSAFRIHSGRPVMSLRSPARLVSDVRLAFELGARNFLLTHSAEVCSRVLTELGRAFPRPLPFALHLELWSPPNRQLLDQYVELGNGAERPLRHVLL
ncbi:MAG TPA: hypothetical protein VHE61_03185, partial [Opitutaceae bacterium]|nr:hypothetical protein [Opitutaceae bacterium]